MKTCILFPGQGAQAIGMGKDFHETSRAVREMFDVASDIAKIDLKALIFSGTEEELKRTRNTQVSLALVERAASVCLAEHGIHAQGTAGFSLGEWPALVEAGVIDFETMIALVAERGRLMDEAGERSGGSSMAAVMALAPEAIDAALRAAGIEDVWVANYNSPTQCVVSGTVSGLDRAEPVLKEKGAKRVIRLKVSGAFHSPIMRWAYDGFKELLSDKTFADPKMDFYSNVTGAVVKTGAELRKFAAEQIISPVRWTAEEETIKAIGYERLLEAGPGTVLAGLWKSVSEDVPCRPCGTLDGVAAISL